MTKKNPEDLKAYEQFLKAWKNKSLRKDDPIYLIVTRKAYKTASSWNWSDWVDDLIQETFVSLSKGGYNGDGPIEAYIASILGNQIKRYWRKERPNLRSEMPEELPAPSEESFHVKLELSDREKRLIARAPQHLLWYLEFIDEFEGYASERDAAKYGKVTRHKIQRIKEEIRKYLAAGGFTKGAGGKD